MGHRGMAALPERAARVHSASDSSREGLFTSVGAMGAAVLASLCCIGPVLVVTLGAGAGLASTFEPLRPVFTALTAVLLAVGFYIVYRKKPVLQGADDHCAEDAACAVPGNRKRDKAVLWTATVFAAVLWTFPYWSRLLI